MFLNLQKYFMIAVNDSSHIYHIPSHKCTNLFKTLRKDLSEPFRQAFEYQNM